MLAPWKKSYDKPRQRIKKQKHYFANKGPYSQGYCFSSSHVWMWEELMLLDLVLEKTLEGPLDFKAIRPVNAKGNQFWIFIGRTDAEAPIFWPPDVNNPLIKKDPDAGKDWRQEEKGTTEDEMVGWHHGLNRHESEQTLGDSEGQRSLTCCIPWGLSSSPWGCKELDTT